MQSQNGDADKGLGEGVAAQGVSAEPASDAGNGAAHVGNAGRAASPGEPFQLPREGGRGELL